MKGEREGEAHLHDPVAGVVVICGEGGEDDHAGCHGGGPEGESLVVQEGQHCQVLGQLFHGCVCFRRLEIKPAEGRHGRSRFISTVPLEKLYRGKSVR